MKPVWFALPLLLVESKDMECDIPTLAVSPRR